MIPNCNLTNRIRTVSVIEISGPAQLVLHSYPDTEAGNRDAEAHFIAIALAQEVDGPTSSSPRFHNFQIENAIEDGHIQDGLGWELYLIHSEV